MILDRKQRFDSSLWGFLFCFVLFVSCFKISVLRVVFLRRGFTIADLKADGKRRESRESLIIDVRCGRRWSRQWVKKKMWAENLGHTFLQWTASVFSSLHLPRQTEIHPRSYQRKVHRGQRAG